MQRISEEAVAKIRQRAEGIAREGSGFYVEARVGSQNHRGECCRAVWDDGRKNVAADRLIISLVDDILALLNSSVPRTEPYVSLMAFAGRLRLALDPAAREEFGEPEEIILRRAMTQCGMSDYPPVSGDPSGTRASGDCICEKCGQTFYAHPMDWRVIGYGNVPFLNVLCNGERVKL